MGGRLASPIHFEHVTARTQTGFFSVSDELLKKNTRALSTDTERRKNNI